MLRVPSSSAAVCYAGRNTPDDSHTCTSYTALGRIPAVSDGYHPLQEIQLPQGGITLSHRA